MMLFYSISSIFSHTLQWGARVRVTTRETYKSIKKGGDHDLLLEEWHEANFAAVSFLPGRIKVE